MKVLHLNNPAQVASNLVKAQRKLGIDANLAVTSTKGWHTNFDYIKIILNAKILDIHTVLSNRLNSQQHTM